MAKILDFPNYITEFRDSTISSIKQITSDTSELYQTNIYNRYFIDEALLSVKRKEFIPASEDYDRFRSKILTYFHENRKEDYLSRSLKGQETETIATYITPVLDALGWGRDRYGSCITREASVPKIKNNKKSSEKLDITILKESSSVDELKALQNSKKCTPENFFKILKQEVINVVEAKTIGSLLKDASEKPRKANAKSAGEDTPNRQTYSYLSDLELDYGFVSDGRYWRMIHSKYEINDNKYFQIDLNSLFQIALAEFNSTDESLEYYLRNNTRIELELGLAMFYNFFSKETLHSKKDDPNTVISYLDKHTDKFFSHLEDKLKDRFVLAMTNLSNGFAEELIENGEDPEDFKDIIRTTSESFLFNIIFIRSLEMKGMLPYFSNDRYKENVSVSYVVDDILYKNNKVFTDSTEKSQFDLLSMLEGYKNIGPDSYSIYDRLVKCIKTIVKGKDFGFAKFDESIFSPDEKQFSQNYPPKDKFFINALFFMCFVPVDEIEDKDKHFQLIPYESLTPREIGSLYESFLEYDLIKVTEPLIYWNFAKKKWMPKKKSVKAKNREVVKKGYLKFEQKDSNHDRKKSGSYYTPHYVVRKIVEQTLNPIVEELSSEDILKLKICDPAMGSGHFLSTTLDYLTEAYLSNDGVFETYEKAARKVLDSCIFGVDMNPSAVKLAKISLWLKTATKDEKLECLEDQLLCRNSLFTKQMHEEYSSEYEVSWLPLQIQKDFCRKSLKGFDALVGNPPWGAHLSEETVEILNEKYPSSKYKLNDSFKYFIELSGSLSHDETRVGYIVPKSLLSHIGCKDSREYLMNNGLEEVINMGDGVFENVTAPCCIFISDNSSSPTKFKYYDGTQARNYQDLRKIKGKMVNYSSVKNNPASEFILSSREIYLSMDNVYQLSELCDVFDSGIDYSRKKLGDAVFYDADRPSSKKDYKVLRGKNINRFTLHEGVKFLRSNWKNIEEEQKKEDKKTRLKVNEKAYKDKIKILVRQTADEVIGTIDTKQYFNQKSLLSIHSKKGTKIDLYYVLGVLNSQFATDIYRELVEEEGQAFSQVKKNKLELIPIPFGVSKEVEKEISGIVKKLLKINDMKKSEYDEKVETLNSLVSSLYDNVEVKKIAA